MLWNKSKNDEASKNISSVLVTTIPMEFYAGSNPVIKFKNVEKTVYQDKHETEGLKIKPDASLNPVHTKAAGLFSSRKFLFLGAGVLFIVFVASASFYYWNLSKKSTAPIVDNNPPSDTKKLEPNEGSKIVIPTSTTSTEPVVVSSNDVPTTTSAIEDPKIEYPSILLGDSVDLDGDGLSDLAEELFSSDAGKEDTDGDGYDDSLEIFHLYSPTGFAPTKLISTSAVKEFTNPIHKYKVYYPGNWAVGNVDLAYSEMLFSTITGENIEIRVVNKASSENFEQWFAKWAPNEKFNNLKGFTTVFKRSGFVRNDNLVYYFPDGNKVFVLVYHTTESSIVNFRNILTMMARSFRLDGESSELPDQMIIIQPPAEEAQN